MCVTCPDVDSLTRELAVGVGVILTTEEVLSSRAIRPLIDALHEQPTWSAIPVLAFYSGSTALSAQKKTERSPVYDLADVTHLQRPVSRANLVSAVKAALRDRSRQYRIRDLLLKSEEAKSMAQEASQMKSQFLANMSHEIRTPLGAIMGFLELIKNNGASKEEIDEYISIIDRNSVQLMRLIDDILDLSKVEAGKMEIERVAFSLGELLFDFTALMGFKAREKGVLFDLHLATPVPAHIYSDPTRIRQVLTNAVGNAIKFTDRGRVHVVCSHQNGELKFVITDSGKGISKEQTAKLFQPFTQADSSTTRSYGGTGLGLVVSRGICRQMGGDFFLESSTPGIGSSFVATFIIDPVPGTEMLEEASLGSPLVSTVSTKDQPLAHMKILLVDDAPDNRALFRIMLSKLGANVDLAENGREGVDRAKENSYDVILMDIQMPHMDGHEATRLLRKGGTKTPIIALTAHAMKEELERTVASGFTDFLSKPLRREALVQALLKYRQHSHAAHEPT